MLLYNLARKVNRYIKEYKKKQSGKHLSPCRRIEFVAPNSSSRFVAMTFDDGPTTMPTTSNSNIGLTEKILEVLKKHGAKGTFDIIGSTKENYPDIEGKAGNFTWSGVHFDHYPKFNDDLSAGAFNQPNLIEKILNEGHEITSHTYSHKLFGPMRAIYGQRTHFNTLTEVVNDLEKLHNYMLEKYNYKITLSRPPHYIDNIPDGSTSYDAYRIMGYNYLAASFDGAGWQPRDTYEKEIDDMITPLKTALENNPNSLNGKIIFQKDGCNMNLRTPVADALDEQLSLLDKYNYKVITVSELLNMCPFEDISNECEKIDYIRELLKFNHVIGYKNNTFQPNRYLTIDEFYIMCCNPELFKVKTKITYSEMVNIAKKYAKDNNITIDAVNSKSLIRIAERMDLNIDTKSLKNKNKISRIEAIELIYAIVKKVGADEKSHNHRN